MDEIVGETSGETAFNHVLTMGGFPARPQADEYTGNLFEAQYVLDQAKEYGLADAAIVRFPGGETWDGVKGELWEVKPGRQKIASYTDLTAMLAQGSASADVTAELIWVGDGRAKDFAGLEVKDKIVVTSGSAGQVHNPACLGKGAAGVISFASPRPLFDPLLIPWGGSTAGAAASGDGQVRLLPAAARRRPAARPAEAGREDHRPGRGRVHDGKCRAAGHRRLDPRDRPRTPRRSSSRAHIFEGFTKFRSQRQLLGLRGDPRGGPHAADADPRRPPAQAQADDPLPLGAGIFRHGPLRQGQPRADAPDPLRHQPGHGRRSG